MDESHFAEIPVIVYGVNLFLAGGAFYLLELSVARIPGQGERFREVYGQTVKEWASMGLYVIGLLLALVAPWAGIAVFTVVAILWIIPDRRVERFLATK
jgi:uncharacterized membrane protein